MISREEALTKARKHLDGTPPPVDTVWVLEPAQRVASGWYFDYTFDYSSSTHETELPSVGGAPGFLVSDDGAVRVVGWNEHSQLQRQRNEPNVA
ncbi:MAG: hypothetical protein K8R23_15610 [Chthoniobacter sp.]|nr:hypothetical protein [Chthoniobacter sp.]